MSPEPDDAPEPCGCGHPLCDCADGQCWCQATAGEIVGEVLGTFPGSYITGTRLLDPAECPDAQKP